MDGDRRLERQQRLMLIVGAVSLSIAIIVGVDLAVNEGGEGRVWTVIGSSFTAIAMAIGWFSLRAARRNRASDPDSGGPEQ